MAGRHHCPHVAARALVTLPRPCSRSSWRRSPSPPRPAPPVSRRHAPRARASTGRKHPAQAQAPRRSSTPGSQQKPKAPPKPPGSRPELRRVARTPATSAFPTGQRADQIAIRNRVLLRRSRAPGAGAAPAPAPRWPTNGTHPDGHLVLRRLDDRPARWSRPRKRGVSVQVIAAKSRQQGPRRLAVAAQEAGPEALPAGLSRPPARRSASRASAAARAAARAGPRTRSTSCSQRRRHPRCAASPSRPR